MLFEYEFDESLGGLVGLSLVAVPAVDSNFICFAKSTKLAFNEEKRIVTGCALRANYIIPRDGYSIVFRPKQIERLVVESMAKGFPTTLNHEGKTNGAYLVESWFLRAPDERFEGVEPGSWMVSYRITDDNIWKAATAGELKGFSVELLANVPSGKYCKNVPAFIF